MSTRAFADGSETIPPPLRVFVDKPAEPGEQLLLAHSPYHPRSEQIRMLRTELLLRHEPGGGANVVAVMSPCALEGRSQLAAELAIAFSQLGRPTLLVDADLRHPQQHVLFNVDNASGLAQAIERDSVPRFHSVANLPSLFLLPAGPAPPNPLELLSSRSFETLAGEWRQHFEYVVVDTPPVSRYADGLAVATITGRVLSLSRARRTPYRDTREMMRRLGATQSRILGAVINHF
ncbi:MAG TPA: CpsD/CapB family tyrosine-protein kinase [Verrucomicrobiae bacterium]|nr:CpsD/CapB family tyrosine-protein kinase [Verrucomicrobiae bacterium]